MKGSRRSGNCDLEDAGRFLGCEGGGVFREEDGAAFEVRSEAAGDYGDKREAFGVRVGDGFAAGEVVEGGFEEGTGGQCFWAEGFRPSLGVHSGFGIGEVDAGEGLFDMELTGIAI